MTTLEQGKIFTSFLRIGLLGFGGGPSMVPLIHHEVVKRHKWLQDEEFSDVLAIANTLPGPIATKLPGYIGYRVAGITGCINAVLSVIFPMIVVMTLMLGLFSAYKDVQVIQGMGQGVIPVVMVMMVRLTWDFWKKSVSTLNWKIASLMVTGAGILIYVAGIHPGIVILILLVTALLTPTKNIAVPLPSKGERE